MRAFPIASLLALVAVVACESILDSTEVQTREPTLAEVRTATERFRDVSIALAEGYVRDPGNVCDEAPMMGKPAALGNMGIHYFRPDLLGITGPPNPRVSGTGTHTDFNRPAILIYEPQQNGHTDFNRPAILIYEPQQNGKLELVAVENLVFIDAWEKAGRKQIPSFQGVPYDRMRDDPATTVDEAHLFAPHYDRHVWLYRENPNGIYAQFNPNVSCKWHTGAQKHAH
jgi:hypothetical protein